MEHVAVARDDVVARGLDAIHGSPLPQLRVVGIGIRAHRFAERVERDRGHASLLSEAPARGGARFERSDEIGPRAGAKQSIHEQPLELAREPLRRAARRGSVFELDSRVQRPQDGDGHQHVEQHLGVDAVLGAGALDDLAHLGRATLQGLAREGALGEHQVQREARDLRVLEEMLGEEVDALGQRPRLGDQTHDFGEELVGHGAHQVVARAEVLVGGRAVEIGCARDRGDGEALRAAVGHQPAGGIEDPAPGALEIHAAGSARGGMGSSGHASGLARRLGKVNTAVEVTAARRASAFLCPPARGLPRIPSPTARCALRRL